MTTLAGFWYPHLLQSLWQATAVGIAILAFLRLFPRTHPRFRHALALIAFAKFALPPMLPLPTGIFSAAPPAAEIGVVRQLAIAGLQPGMLWIVVALMALHGAGFALAIARIAVEAARLHGIRRRSAGKGLIRFTDEVSVPMAAGVFSPIILIPNALARAVSEAMLADVVAHEREHIRRRDVLLNYVQELIAAFWWFHPVIHLLGREARTIREECCDDALLARGLCERDRYARTLLDAADFTARHPMTAAAIVESRGALLRRIRRIADADRAPSQRLGQAAVLAIILLSLLLLPGLRVSDTNRFAFDRGTWDAIGHRHTHHP